jgi:hypothetical protein
MHGLLSGGPDVHVLGGLTVVGGNGFDMPPGTVVSVTSLPDALQLLCIRGHDGQARIPYSELLTLELAGGAQTTGGRFFGGGFGLQAAAEGMIAASVLNAVTSQTTIDTLWHIGSTRGEAILHSGGATPSQVRAAFSVVWTRLEAAKRAPLEERPTPDSDPITQLERIAKLRDNGIMSETEYQAARLRLVARLS